MLQQILNGLSLGTIYAVVAVGFSLTYNVLRLSNLAHGGMLLAGAYVGYYVLKAKIPAGPALLIAALAAGALSLLLEKIILKPIRSRGRPLVFFFMASMTSFTLMENFVSAATGANVMSYPSTALSQVFMVGDIRISMIDITVLIGTILALLATTSVLYRTRVGLAIRCAAQDPRAASLCGIDLDKVISVAFVISGLLGGIGGFFLGMNYTVNPELGQMVFKSFAACMIGGMGSIPGAVFGALLFGITETMLIAYVNSALAPTLAYAMVIAFLLLKPSGLMGVYVEKL
ncbi:MAG: branched-chain amino acid ABC transporter permease [Bacillota bacterium]|nr:branched-chain amino acid ABC transporter permease [Bacillota bacterium]